MSDTNLSRRMLLQSFALAPVAIRQALAAQALSYLNLDHVSVQVSDLVKGMDFYSRVFGATVRKENESARSYVKLGSAYMALSQSRNGVLVDHF